MRREATAISRRVFALALRTLLLALVFFTTCSSVYAQKATKIPRLGFLGTASASIVADRVDALRKGLRELGYIEGENIVLDLRFGEGKSDEVTALAMEFVHSKIDVIVTAGPAATRSAKQATATIPIVMGNEGDPVGSGFVTSLARPGGNITGLSALAPEISGKQLEILKEIVPKLLHVFTLGIPRRQEIHKC